MASKYLGSVVSAALLLSSVLASPTVEYSSSLSKRDGVIPEVLPGSWTSLGCYNEIGRTLTGGGYDNATTNTIELCIGYCEARGFIYAGTEYGSQCWCGNRITPPSAPATGCTFTCGGNSTQACGGADRLNIFWSGQTGPQTNPGPGLWSSLGCYTEGLTGRLLVNGVATVGGAEALTIALCTDACQAGGYALAGAEYGQECWCGNTLSNGGTLAPEATECNVLCKGNGSEFCGGPSRLNVYNFNGTFTPPTPPTTTTTTVSPTAVPTAGSYVYYGCQTEGYNVRALSAKGTTSATMTIGTCEAFCSGYTYFGTEYGSECWCGNSFGNGSTSVPDTECNFRCPGDVSQFCGAGDRLSVYIRNGTDAPQPTPTAPPANLPTGWSSQGCWVDGQFGRILSTQQPDSATLTIESCIGACSAAGFTIAGLEYSSQCFCDTQIRNGGSLAIAQTDCNMPCSGNSAQVCGAGNRLSIYSVGTPVVNPPA